MRGGTWATYGSAGAASGSVGAKKFANATLNVTGTADITNIGNGGPFPFNEIDFHPGSAVLSISGVASSTFTNLVYIVEDYGTGVLLLASLFPSGNADVIELTDTDLGSGCC
jgi:hypothetical protein